MFGMYLGGQWYQCQIHEKDKSSDPVENLDVFVLQEKVLAPLFGWRMGSGIRNASDLDRGTVCGCGRRKTDAAKIQLV